MKAKSFILLLSLVTLLGCQTNSLPPVAKTTANTKNTYVLVHGAWGGGWDWRHMDDLLTADGNEVHRATLTGLGERTHLANTNIDLETHIQDVVSVILWENLHDVILVGHSYGGMVITGVADRIPDRIKHVIYVDAMLPTNGESAVTAWPVHSHSRQLETDGFIIPAWVQPGTPPPHDSPQPAKTFSTPIVLTNQTLALKIPATYILTVEAGQPAAKDPFYYFYQRAQARNWPAWIMEGDHNVQRSHPQELRQLLEKAAQ